MIELLCLLVITTGHPVRDVVRCCGTRTTPSHALVISASDMDLNGCSNSEFVFHIWQRNFDLIEKQINCVRTFGRVTVGTLLVSRYRRQNVKCE